MKALILAAAITAAGLSSAYAQGVTIGPGGVTVETQRPEYRERQYYGDRDYGPRYGERYNERRRYGAVERCRTEVTRRINRYGERVIRRERVCD